MMKILFILLVHNSFSLLTCNRHYAQLTLKAGTYLVEINGSKIDLSCWVILHLQLTDKSPSTMNAVCLSLENKFIHMSKQMHYEG